MYPCLKALEISDKTVQLYFIYTSIKLDNMKNMGSKELFKPNLILLGCDG